jgi:hypothetical protein
MLAVSRCDLAAAVWIYGANMILLSVTAFAIARAAGRDSGRADEPDGRVKFVVLILSAVLSMIASLWSPDYAMLLYLLVLASSLVARAVYRGQPARIARPRFTCSYPGKSWIRRRAIFSSMCHLLTLQMKELRAKRSTAISMIFEKSSSKSSQRCHDRGETQPGQSSAVWFFIHFPHTPRRRRRGTWRSSPPCPAFLHALPLRCLRASPSRRASLRSRAPVA